MTTAIGAPSESTTEGIEEPVVRLRDVFCVHRTSEGDAAALQGTTLEITKGELVCVIGPSGAGKSTLLRVIAGLQEPSAGSVQVLGWDMGRIAPRLRARLRHSSIGFLPQHADAVLPPDLRACEAVALPLALRGAARDAQLQRAEELLSAAGIAKRAEALPGELSGGERQRLALCAALAHRPALLLADEPTGELDLHSAHSVRELIAGLSRAHGTTVVLVSHDPDAAAFADRSVRLRDGRVAEDRRAGERGVVVAPGGWLHLPPELLSAAGIGDRADITVADDGLVLRAAPESRAPEQTGSDTLPAADATWQPALVALRGVTRARGLGRARREVLEDFSARTTPGRLTVIRGPSGSGKTTLLRMLAALDTPDRGEIVIDGEDVSGLDEERRAAMRRARIGYLPQEPSPIGFLSAEENVALALRLRGVGAVQALRRAAVILAWLGLSDRARQRVTRLSAGEAQRVALARALACARGLLIVDEPTSRLDEARAASVAELLAQAAVQDAQTVICATHDAQLIAAAHEVIDLGQ
jgi:ABC-type lipoprotein export system ATPase subunit